MIGEDDCFGVEFGVDVDEECLCWVFVLECVDLYFFCEKVVDCVFEVSM